MSRPGIASPRQRAFTLLELLVVVGLIAATSFLLLGGLGGSDDSTALQSSQAVVANLITAARTKAAITGRKVRLLVNADPAQPDRYLRFVLLQLARQPGSTSADWDTIQSVLLPEGIYVAPGALAGLVAEPAAWKRTSDASAELASDLFANQGFLYAFDGDGAAQFWLGVAFTANGTLAAVAGGPPPKGAWILAVGQTRPLGSYSAGQPPVQFSEPARVRGVMLSAYGVPALLDDRSAF